MINQLFSIDFETIPIFNEDTIMEYRDSLVEKVKKDGRLKPETILKKIQEIDEKILMFKMGGFDESMDEMIKIFSVNPLRNRIIGVGISHVNEDDEIQSFGYADEDESKIIDFIFEKMKEKQKDLGIEDFIFLGHNVRGFDIPTLRQSIIRNKKPLTFSLKKRQFLLPIKKYENFIIDTMDMYDTKLDVACKAVLGEGKIDSGSNVYNLYRNKKFQEIADYGKDDAYKTLQLALKSFI